MKSISIIICMFLSSSLLAQDKSAQIELGLSQSWFNYKLNIANNDVVEFDPQLTFGFNYKIYTLSDFSLTAGLRYHDLFKYFDMSPYGYSKGDYSTVDNYLLSIPLQIKYNIGIINTKLSINFEPSYLLKTKLNSPSRSVWFTLEEHEVTNEMERIHLAVGVGLEYVFNIADQNIGIKTGYSIGLTSIPKKGNFTSDDYGTHEWLDYKTTELNLLLTYYL